MRKMLHALAVWWVDADVFSYTHTRGKEIIDSQGKPVGRASRISWLSSKALAWLNNLTSCVGENYAYRPPQEDDVFILLGSGKHMMYGPRTYKAWLEVKRFSEKPAFPSTHVSTPSKAGNIPHAA